MSDEPFRIGNATDFVEVRCLERGGDDLPNVGDVRLGVAVSSDGFHGTYEGVWIAADRWRAFAASLRRLERERTGQAGVGSMSPDVFRLDVKITDAAGHLEAVGYLSRYHVRSSAGLTRSRVEFHFDVDPSLVRTFADSIAALVTGL